MNWISSQTLMVQFPDEVIDRAALHGRRNVIDVAIRARKKLSWRLLEYCAVGKRENGRKKTELAEENTNERYKR